MTGAREIAYRKLAQKLASALPGEIYAGCEPLFIAFVRDLGAALDAANRAGQEHMREAAAKLFIGGEHTMLRHRHIAEAIRALPITEAK